MQKQHAGQDAVSVHLCERGRQQMTSKWKPKKKWLIYTSIEDNAIGMMLTTDFLGLISCPSFQSWKKKKTTKLLQTPSITFFFQINEHLSPTTDVCLYFQMSFLKRHLLTSLAQRNLIVRRHCKGHFLSVSLKKLTISELSPLIGSEKQNIH